MAAAKPSKVTVRVEKAKLVAHIKAARVAAETENAKAHSAYVKQFAAWKKTAHAAIDAAEEGTYLRLDSAPYLHLTSLAPFDADVALLELAEDTEIVMARDSDFFKYL